VAGTGQAIRFNATGGQIELDLANMSFDPIGTVLRLQFDEPPRKTSTATPIPSTGLIQAGWRDKWDTAVWTTATAKNGRAVYGPAADPGRIELPVRRRQRCADPANLRGSNAAQPGHAAGGTPGGYGSFCRGGRRQGPTRRWSTVVRRAVFRCVAALAGSDGGSTMFSDHRHCGGQIRLMFEDPDKIKKVIYDARVTMIADG